MNIGLKQKLIAASLISAFGMGFSMPSFAQSSDTSGASATSKQASSTAAKMRDMRASELIGKDVQNAKGEDLGEIHDLIVDVGNNEVRYVVLSFGGALGLGEKLFAFPMSAFKPTADGDELVLNVAEERLKKAPGFERNNWPDWADNRYRGEVDRHFKAEMARATPSAKTPLVRAGQLIGKDVNDRKGDNAGEIEDLVVNTGNGKVSFAVVDFDKAWSPDDKLLPVPLTALTFPKDEDEELVLNIERDKLDMARGFEDDSWPDLNDAKFRKDVTAHLRSMERSATAAGPAARDTATGASGEPRGAAGTR